MLFGFKQDVINGENLFLDKCKYNSQVFLSKNIHIPINTGPLFLISKVRSLKLGI